MSSADLAGRMGCSVRTVQGWRQGAHRPEIPMMHHLAVVLRCDPVELAFGDENQNGAGRRRKVS